MARTAALVAESEIGVKWETIKSRVDLNQNTDIQTHRRSSLQCHATSIKTYLEPPLGSCRAFAGRKAYLNKEESVEVPSPSWVVVHLDTKKSAVESLVDKSRPRWEAPRRPGRKVHLTAEGYLRMVCQGRDG